ncbi:MAG: flap endonuclease-1 [Candidatus Lokiarchaeota archaeon]|nr:flap endonuclease-1 [Candidatus Lokiarchaeota archaeon]
MGVKISTLIKPALTEITLPNLLGKKIAIDAFNSIYQFLATIRQPDGTPLRDHQGNVTSHLSGLLFRTLRLIENDIKPLYVFDGPPHELKSQIVQERREKREEEKHKMLQAQDEGDFEEAMKHAQASSKLTSEMIEESKQMLNYMGVPYIEAPHDGEAEAARLTNEGLVWACSSQDYDSLLFGSSRLVRNLTMSRTRRVKGTTIEVQIEYYFLEKVLNELKITREQLIDIGILVGVDFFPGFKGLGEKTAYKLIKENGSIETIINKGIEVRNTPIEIDLELLNTLRKIFLNVKKPDKIPNFVWKKPDEEKLRELLIEQKNFSEERVSSAIKRLVQKKSQKSQVNLDRFF